MRHTPGARLGPYEVIASIGAGGMGEVYRARDTRLNRDVAIKVLPEMFALNAERIARFEREAQVLASLNHPHIAQVHGVIETGLAYDVHPDGRFIMIRRADEESFSNTIRLIVNWFDELKRIGTGR